MKYRSIVLAGLLLTLVIGAPISGLNADPAPVANVVDQVAPVATTTTLSVSAGTLGQPVVITVTVQAPVAAGAPVGTVELLSGGQLFAVPTLSPTISGDPTYAESVATWTFSAGDAIYAQNLTIAASFIGNGNFLNSSNNQSFSVTAPTYSYLSDGVGIATVVTGSGAGVQAGDDATVYYTGFYASDGAEFDESFAHWPSMFYFMVEADPEQVIVGFDEGTAGMEVGETRVLYIPSAEGYDDGKDRIFVVQLLAINGVPTFTSTAPPVITITAPAESGEEVNKALFTVAGTAQGNVAVTNVQVSLNGGGWLPVTVNNEGNWSEQVTLAYGNNTFDVYAVDANGNVSFDHEADVNSTVQPPPPGETLTVEITGDGSVSPEDNGVTLTNGVTYKLTATPAKNYAFIDWTDGNDEVLTNGVNLRFVMSSNLVLIANFKYALDPSLSITAPAKTGEKWSNAVYTVTGKCADAQGVSNVLVAINGGAWTGASLTDGNSNWTEQVNLTAGTNTISVYAVNISGNVSTTTTVKLVYVVAAPLTVNIAGNGTVKTDYNGDLLAIGVKYSMKATADKGFGFEYWNVGAAVSNNATLDFVMASNLVITANFKDITAPTIAITLPKANEKGSNSVINVTGTASDNVGVAVVKVQLNANGWMTANGTNSWSASLSPVVLGANTVRAYAVDAAGNISKTNTVKFTGEAPLN